jgi:hypothetical protein
LLVVLYGILTLRKFSKLEIKNLSIRKIFSDRTLSINVIEYY